MARTTVAKVKEILDTALTDPQVDNYIDIANTMVTNNVTCGLSATVLAEIERWLAAHLISITQERLGIKEKVGDAEITYTGVFGEGLKSTSYGQTVLMLDTCGGLANLGKKSISIKAITSFE